MRVQLNGEVISDEWGWLYAWLGIPAIYPQKVRQALADLPDGHGLTLEINSGGGSVLAGFEIYSILQNAGKQGIRTVAEVQSLAASAATVIMAGCSMVTASPVAQIMIHLPTCETEGNQNDHMDSAAVLESITESILNAYVIQCGGRSSRNELRRLMETSTWMTATEAKGLGLIHRILGEEQLDPALIVASIGGTGHGIRALSASARPDRAAMLAAYQAAVDRGEAPERPEAGILRREPAAVQPQQDQEGAAETQQDNETELQAAQAVLALEKIRFGGM